MQRITNCILVHQEKVLLLKKPSRGWWGAPGGKMEAGESVKDSVVREFVEETGLTVHNPLLRGVFTIVIEDDIGQANHEWMLYTFVAKETTGELVGVSPEGKLAWQSIGDIPSLPMNEGDRQMILHILATEQTVYGTLYYSWDRELRNIKLEV